MVPVAKSMGLNDTKWYMPRAPYKAPHKIPLLAGAIIKDFIKDNELYLSVKMESK